MFYLLGTVFQTAILVMFIIPRLRPGLLSLRSVLSSRQSFFLILPDNAGNTVALSCRLIVSHCEL